MTVLSVRFHPLAVRLVTRRRWVQSERLSEPAYGLGKPNAMSLGRRSLT
ncbi:MAG: hypothetical protein QOD93_6700, partial [Acetobacteraceae bacterium]|nr:hypothetical protein [Acetobacteraceae bacterium]